MSASPSTLRRELRSEALGLALSADVNQLHCLRGLGESIDRCRDRLIRDAREVPSAVIEAFRKLGGAS